MSTGINIAPSSDITVGTTAVTSGTNGRVFFQAGGVIQQDANFTYDNTLKRLGLKAAGTAATDIPLSISNSAGTLNLFQVSGNSAYFNGPAGTAFSPIFALYRNNLEVFRIDEYKSQFTGSVYMNSIVGPASSGITFTNQSGSGKLIHMVPTGGTLAIGYGTLTTAAALDVKAQGALSTDIAFRVRNSADTADLISFRGDGSQWIQSVPFIHAGGLTGTTNATQSLHIGYNAAALNSASSNSITIGRGTGASLAGNNNVSIGNANSIGGFSSMLGIGLGVQMIAANTAYIGSETFSYSTMWVSTGGEVSSGANLRGLDFRVSGCAGGLTNQSASGVQVRFFSPNGTGSGAGSNIQFHVAPSNTGGSAFNRNIFSEMFTIRGEADGLNHYQLATPRVPSASITNGYVQYSNDITAGNAAPHFRTENGSIVKLYQETTGVAASTFVTNTSGILNDTATFDGYTIGQVVKALRNLGILA
jgi:hypothetical protein